MERTGRQKSPLLVVDDEHAVRKALVATLQREGYDVLPVASGEEALALLENLTPAVVLSDHRMPGMDGLELLRRCRLLCPEAVRIMVTGQADLELALRAINEDEIFRFVLKPWQRKSMIRVAADAVERRRELAELALQRRRQTERRRPRPAEGARRGVVVLDDDDVQAALAVSAWADAWRVGGAA